MQPFLKWAGGKRQLLAKLLARVPTTYNRYYEPFVGGGALLLALAPKEAVINDANRQLLNCYQQLQRDAGAVLLAVEQLDVGPIDQKYYREIRDRFNQRISGNIFDVETAALLIWLNKHCFNGLYRVNRRGQFNVPFNGNQKPTALDKENLQAVGSYLQNNQVTILNQDFAEACYGVEAGDFVYFDSPYIPVSATADFTDYTQDGFTLADHKRLAELFEMLDALGTKVMLSNNDVPLTRELYGKFKIEEVAVRRSINRDGDKRQGREVIITNY